MRIISLSIFFAALFYFQLSAQIRCYSTEHMIRQEEANPEIKMRRFELNSQINKIIISSDKSANALMTIPVVFHIIHNGDNVGQNENLSNALVMAQLAQLNADFRRTNTNASDTPARFQGVAADTEIEFCLATLDPNNESTTGIIRRNLNTLTGFNQNGCWNDTNIDNGIIIPTRWDATKYLNIYSLEKLDILDNGNCNSNTLLGFAQFPGGALSTDVVVCGYFSLGSLSTKNPAGGVYGYGRTLTHEVGHWLGLYHIWGDGCMEVNECSIDDEIADTPIQACEQTGCPTGVQTDNCNMTTNGIMYMNYMDYVNDECMNMFTTGQKNRMQSVITMFRSGLLNNGKCSAASPCDAIVNVSTASGSSTHKASDLIQSTAVISGSSNITFRAQNRVELNSPFSVAVGAIFQAIIEDCN